MPLLDHSAPFLVKRVSQGMCEGMERAQTFMLVILPTLSLLAPWTKI